MATMTEIGIISVLSAGGWSQAVSAVTIAEVPQLVQTSNRDVQAASQDVDAANAERKMSLGRYFPKIEWKNSYTRLNDDIVIDIGPKRIETDILGDRLKVGIDVDPPPVKVQDKNVLNSHLLLTQPLYTGGRISAGVDAAVAHRDETQLQLQAVTADKTLAAMTRYFQVQLAEESLKVLEVMDGDISRLEKMANDLVAAGVAPKFATLQIKVAHAELRARTEDAKAKQKLAGLAFRSTIGLDMTSPVSFDSALVIVPMATTLDVFKTQALQKRREFKLLETKSRQVGALREAATGGMLPTIYGFGKRELLTDQLTMLQPIWAVGIGIDVPLTAGITQFPEREKALRLEQKIQTLREKATIDIPLEVESYFDSAVAARAGITALDEGQAMAKEALRLAEVRFKSGSGSSVEVVKAATDLETIEIKRLLLVEEYNRRLMELYNAAGAPGDYVRAYQASVKSEIKPNTQPEKG